MKHRLRITIVGAAFTLLSGVTLPPPADAAPSHSGTITGTFDSPVLIGAFLDADSRLPIPCDNTSGPGGPGVETDSFTWSDNLRGLPPSTLSFVGNSFSDVAQGEVFPLGSLTYFNGWNSPASLVFGLTMHLSADDGVAPFAGPVDIVSTLNGNLDPMVDADVLSFGTFEIPSTLAAIEKTAVTAIVYGKIGADSALEITSMTLAPGEAEHGCVSEGPLVDARPCARSCGDVCAAVSLAVSQPLCGSEKLPAALQTRIDQALRLLSRGATTNVEKRAKKGVHLAMKQLRRSAAVADREAKNGRISTECAEAVRGAIRNAETQAGAWLNSR